MRAVGRLVQQMCEETRTGWSWVVPLSQEETPPWLAFHGPKGMRSAPDDRPMALIGVPRLELRPAGGANAPMIAVPIAANGNPSADLRRLGAHPLDPRAGWLILLALLHALDEAARARPRSPTVGDALSASGAPMLSTWESALTLGDLEAALLRSCL